MAEQGCQNEGDDTRLFGTVVCWLQRLLSFSTTYEPISVLLAFPPYIAINLPIPFSGITKWGVHKMLHFRVGWRYDMNSHEFSFPTAAIKQVDRGNFY